VGYNAEPLKLSPPPTDLASTQNFVLDGAMSSEVDAYAVNLEKVAAYSEIEPRGAPGFSS